MTGEYRIEAPPERVYAALNDPEILKQCIPGCETLEKHSETEMEAKVVAKVGPVKARFTGQVTLSDLVPPESYSINGQGKGGAAGHAKGGARVKLVPDGSATLLRYQVHADVGGKLAQLGSRLIDGTAKKMANDFFTSFVDLVAAPEAASVSPAGRPETPASEPAAAAGSGVNPVVWAIGIGVLALAAAFLLLR